MTSGEQWSVATQLEWLEVVRQSTSPLQRLEIVGDERIQDEVMLGWLHTLDEEELAEFLGHIPRPEVLLEFVTDSRIRIRIAVAGSIHADDRAHQVLVQDPDSRVRFALASHDALDLSIRARLLADESLAVVEMTLWSCAESAEWEVAEEEVDTLDFLYQMVPQAEELALQAELDLAVQEEPPAPTYHQLDLDGVSIEVEAPAPAGETLDPDAWTPTDAQAEGILKDILGATEVPE